MLSLGLTGNLGTGKSTVARQLVQRGAAVLDADRVVHSLLAPGGAAVEPVLAAFPATLAAASADEGPREVDRSALGRLVFADREALRQLESILHPLVIARQHAWLDEQEALGTRIAVVEASQLIEAWRAGGPDPHERFDALIVVTCDEDVQLARAVARAVSRGVPLDEAERDARARIAAQAPQAEKAALADEVIDNSGSPEETAALVEQMLARLERPGELE